MSFTTLVDSICQEIKQEAMKSYQEQWLVYQQTKIENKVNKTTRLPYYMKPQLIRDVTDEYVALFSKEVKPRLNQVWQDKLIEKSGYFVEKLEAFFKRHPWLEVYKDDETTASPAYLFMRTVIKKTLVSVNGEVIQDARLLPYGRRHAQNNIVKSGDYALNFNLNVTHTDTTYCQISWPEQDKLDIEYYLNDFPLRSVVRHRFNWHSFVKLPFNERSAITATQKKDYVFSRLDAYRFLRNHLDPETNLYTARDKVIKDGQIVAKVMPVELGELAVLDDITKKYCQHWLINTGSVNNACWVFLTPKEDLTLLYAPKELIDSRHWQNILKQINTFKPVDGITSVENQCSTEYADIKPANIWQYHLFARVLPYCLETSQLVPFESYRNRLPLYHLVAYVWQYIETYQLLESPNYNAYSAFQLANPFHQKKWHQLLCSQRLDEHKKIKTSHFLDAGKLLQATDHHDITFVPSTGNASQVILKAKVEGDYFIQACFMACFEKTSHIELTLSDNSKKNMPDMPMYIFEKLTERLDYVQFKQAEPTSLINPGHFPPLVRLSNAAAVNRLLQNVYQQDIDKLEIEDRWFEAGKVICALFQKQQSQPHPLNIPQYLEQMAIWQAEQFHPRHTPLEESNKWQMAQFAQMGRMGLDVLFDYLRATYLEPWQPIIDMPVLNLPVMFDLNGDRLLSAAQYIEHLNDQLLTFINDERCTKKFSQIHLIVPRKLTRDAISALSQLIKGISDCNYEQGKVTAPIYLHDFLSLSGSEQNALLKAFEQLASSEAQPIIQRLIIRELDNQISGNEQANALKNRYRALQNKILDNQRHARQPKLEESTKIFYQGAVGTLDPMVDIRSGQHRLLQPFEGKEQTLLLSSKAPGIQQELQQNVEARHEVVQQIERKLVLFEQTVPQIKTYRLDLNRLITRNNIQQRFEKRDPSMHWQKAFNQWVGSHKDAPCLINYLEPEAVEIIFKHNTYFQMGLEYSQLPFGFFLRYHPEQEKSYILCYDDNQAKKDLHQWQLKTKELRNPFILHLDDKEKAVHFEGDLRQFELIGTDASAQVAFWYHLATQSLSSEQQQQEKAICLRSAFRKHINPNHPHLDVQMMHYELSNDIQVPWTLANVKNLIASWAQTQLKDKADKQDFCLHFIGALDAAQLKSLGQLCYHFDSQSDLLGSAHFLNVCYAMYQTFGKSHFSVWQTYVLAKLDNSKEVLDKSLLDSMGLSLIALKEKSSVYTNIWFRLLKTQSEHGDYVRYDRLWYAYQAVIAYVDAKQLWLDEIIVAHMLDKQKAFQVVPWLDRFYHCLKMMEGQLYEKQAQQSLLDNLPQVDWHSSDLIYAMRYNQMPYWSQDLMLTDFSYADPQKGYEACWDPLDIHAPFNDMLPVLFSRFLTAKLRLNFKEYQYYSQQIKPLLNAHKISYSTARLLLIHLSHGVDQMSDLSAKDIDAVLQQLNTASLEPALTWLNEQFFLDGPLIAGQYQVALKHLPLIADVLQSYGLDKVSSLPDGSRKSLLNALGRVYQYLQSQPAIALERQLEKSVAMLDNAIKNPAYLDAMCQTPWLLMANVSSNITWQKSKSKKQLACQNKLLSQLESIVYKNTTWLPSKKEIQKALNAINNSDIKLSQLDNIRHHFIGTWLEKGCEIAFQEGAFRVLEPQEQTMLSALLSEQLLPQHTKENMALIQLLLPAFAIEANSTQAKQSIIDFVFQLKRIDNKPHFNDLSVVLGNILSELQKYRLAKVSLPHLTEVLDTLMHAEHDETTHFQNELLSQVIAHSSTFLISNNCHELSKAMLPAFKLRVKQLFTMKIPNQVKPILLSLIDKGCTDEQFKKIIDNFYVYGIVNLEVNFQIEQAKALLLVISNPSANTGKYLDCLLYGAASSDNHSLWFKTRTQLLKQLNKEKSINALETMAPYLLSYSQKASEIEIIAYHAGRTDIEDFAALYPILENSDKEMLTQLATLCAYPKAPTAAYLIAQLPEKSAADLIHHFKTVECANGLRNYSISLNDQQSLQRLLGNIKVKGKGYISDAKQKDIIGKLYFVNAYAQEKELANLRCQDLKADIRQTALRLQQAQAPQAINTYRLQLLAMLREVLLRETGMWANHTQMLDLVYAAMHNNESLFHQVKTGQGKSIITIMRVAYHALNGKVVDVFTAKEDLSSRDHKEFGHILDAIGIEHAHIVAQDDEQAYKVGDELFGAVNYLTPGSFSLYQSGHCWQESSQRFINFSSLDRVAFFDEGDHVLLDEQTMFNFSFGGETGSLYNYDTWVYQAAWQYFQSVKNTLPVNEKGIAYISRKEHLAGLCAHLQKQGDLAPVQSTFIQRYFAPVVDDKVKNKAAAIEKRDKVLGHLFSAAYVASHLEKHKDFCIQSETLTLADGSQLQTRAAKVVISNQVQAGATYSERAHQFLLVRLNEEALAQGEAPNFLITPDSDIVLSQNVPAIIKHYYGQIEGCSGTMGDKGELAVYQARFDIDHVVKLPTHEVSQTQYLGTVFCDNELEHEQAIIECLKSHRQHPTLLVSQDDVAVKSLSKRMHALLPEDMLEAYACDTNDSGQTEQNILAFAGKAGSIVNSARMARGTDIKPQTKAGLLVIRANPSIPRIAKQSGGRQGRNGDKGVLVDIIDYSKVKKSFEAFEQSTKYSDRLHELMQREALHLQEKLDKHQRNNSPKWDWLRNDPLKREKYLKTRVVEYLKYEIKIKNEQFIRAKEAVVSECSVHVMQLLMQKTGEDQTLSNQVRTDWMACRSVIDSAWQQRMKGVKEENEEVFDAFYEKAIKAWQGFVAPYSNFLNSLLLNDKEGVIHSSRSMRHLTWQKDSALQPQALSMQQENMPEVIQFYQSWLVNVAKEVLAGLEQPLQKQFYGEAINGMNGLDMFYHALIKASQSSANDIEDSQNTKLLFNTLDALPANQIIKVPLTAMTAMVNIYGQAKATLNYQEKLNGLTQLFQHPCFTERTPVDSHTMTILAEIGQFVSLLTCQTFVNQAQASYQRFDTSDAIKFIANAFKNSNWQSLNPKRFSTLTHFIIKNENIGKLFVTLLNNKQWHKLIMQLMRYDMSQGSDKAYIDNVLDYLEQHQALLSQTHQEILPDLLDIFFYYPKRRIDVETFITPNCLFHANLEENIQFTQFIAEQYMINQAELSALVDLINGYYHDDNISVKKMRNKVLPRVRTLPANIPFELIRERVESIAEDHSLKGFEQSINALTQVGLSLNAFTQSKGITTLENSLPSEGDNELLLQRAQTIITNKNAAGQLTQAWMFFQTANNSDYAALDANTCLLAIELFGETYKSVLNILLSAKASMTENTYVLFHQALFSDKEDKLSFNTFKKITTFFEAHASRFAYSLETRQQQQQKVLETCLVPDNFELVAKKLALLQKQGCDLNDQHLWLKFIEQTHSVDAFEKTLSFVQQTSHLHPDLSADVLALLDNNYDQKRLSSFVNLAVKELATLAPMPIEQLQAILKKWQDKKIIDADHLSRVFKAQTLANVLETETNDNKQLRKQKGTDTIESLFESFAQKSQPGKRFDLMHSINHALITCCAELKNKCWDFYQSVLNDKVGDIKQKIEQLPEGKRATALGELLSTIRAWTSELVEIATPIKEQINHPTYKYHKLARSFDAEYTGSWLKFFSINRVRRQQADLLFKNIQPTIMGALKTDKYDDFYSNMLDHIQKTQQDILEKDKVNGIANAKGYSRLLDITQQLGLQLCKDIILDRTLDSKTKIKAQDWLKQQEKVLIEQLWHRLPAAHPLVPRIQGVAKNPEAATASDIHQCKVAIGELELSSLPKELAYLFPLLKGHFESEENFEEKSFKGFQ